MKFNHKLTKAKLSAVTLCLGVSFGMSLLIGSTDPFMGLMLGIITIGVYIMIVSGKWNSKNK